MNGDNSIWQKYFLALSLWKGLLEIKVIFTDLFFSALTVYTKLINIAKISQIL